MKRKKGKAKLAVPKKTVRVKGGRLPWWLAELPEEAKSAYRRLERAGDRELVKVFSRNASTRIDLEKPTYRFTSDFINWVEHRKGWEEAQRLEKLFEKGQRKRDARVKARILGMQEKRQAFYRQWGLGEGQVRKAFNELPDFRTHIHYASYLYMLKPYAPVLAFADKVLKGKGRVLELGFGHPAFLEVLKKRGYQTTGLDPNLPEDRKAVKRLNLVQGDARKLAECLPAGKKFDLVFYKGTSDNVLRHKVDAKAVAGRLRPGGYLVFVLEHFHRRTHSLFEQHGLERVTANALFPFAFKFKFKGGKKPTEFPYYVTVMRKPKK